MNRNFIFVLISLVTLFSIVNAITQFKECVEFPDAELLTVKLTPDPIKPGEQEFEVSVKLNYTITPATIINLMLLIKLIRNYWRLIIWIFVHKLIVQLTLEQHFPQRINLLYRQNYLLNILLGCIIFWSHLVFVPHSLVQLPLLVLNLTLFCGHGKIFFFSPINIMIIFFNEFMLFLYLYNNT